MPRALRDALAEYPRIMLEAIAEGWGVALTDEHTHEIVERLADEMVSAESVQFVLRRLDEAEREALAYVLALGQVKAHVMTRKYGAIRRLGAGRLEWEAAWRQPVSAAERLWFLGLIYREYAKEERYHGQVFYTPAELRAALPPLGIELPAFGVERAPSPSVVQDDADALAHDAFVVLSYVRRHEVRARSPRRHGLRRDSGGHGAPAPNRGHGVPEGILTAREWAALRPRLAGPSDAQRLRFLLHLCACAGLVVVKEGLWVPSAEAAAWLKGSDVARQRALYQAWLDDDDWNELWLMPGVRCEDTGWRNDPPLPRRVVVEYLRQCPLTTWCTIDSFVESIHQVAPDLMRPDGDYDSWYIRDAQTGQYLTGWGSWPRVEGALIRYLLRHPLRWLGMVAIGRSQAEADASSFMLTEQGAAVLESGEVAPGEPQCIVVQDDLQVVVPAGASWYDRFLLERFAEWIEERDGAARYRLRARSVRACLSGGVTVQQVLAFLRRVSGGRLPPGVVRALQSWADG